MADVKINQSVAILIDGNNIEKSLHSLVGDNNAMINFDTLIPKLLVNRGLNRLIYFREGVSISSKLAGRLHDSYHGSVVPCYKSADIPLSIKAMQLAQKVDTIIILSGDADYVELVRHLKSEGVRVEVAAIPQTTAKILLDEVDYFRPITKEDCFIFNKKPAWGKRNSSSSSKPQANKSLEKPSSKSSKSTEDKGHYYKNGSEDHSRRDDNSRDDIRKDEGKYSRGKPQNRQSNYSSTNSYNRPQYSEKPEYGESNENHYKRDSVSEKAKVERDSRAKDSKKTSSISSRRVIRATEKEKDEREAQSNDVKKTRSSTSRKSTSRSTEKVKLSKEEPKSRSKRKSTTKKEAAEPKAKKTSSRSATKKTPTKKSTASKPARKTRSKASSTKETAKTATKTTRKRASTTKPKAKTATKTTRKTTSRKSKKTSDD